MQREGSRKIQNAKESSGRIATDGEMRRGGGVVAQSGRSRDGREPKTEKGRETNLATNNRKAKLKAQELGIKVQFPTLFWRAPPPGLKILGLETSSEPLGNKT